MRRIISIEGLNIADVLAGLYNAARPRLLGFLTYDPKPMDREEAEKLLKENTYFDYIKGRVIKVDLGTTAFPPGFSPQYYDIYNGRGTAAMVVEQIRLTGQINSKKIQETHYQNTLLGISELINQIIKQNQGSSGLDYSEINDKLLKAIQRTLQALQEKKTY
jgi:hypothetical protein